MSKWQKPSRDGLLPRWEPSYGPAALEGDIFLGYAGPFDIWFDPDGNDGEPALLVVGPDSAKIDNAPYNYDTFYLMGGQLERDGTEDLHIDLHSLCLIYQLCEEHELFKENAND